jgi:glc operon protein GlcG
MGIYLRLICLMALGGFLLSGETAWAQLADKKVITLGVAKKLAVAAEEEAVKNKWNVVIVIVDDGGNLLYLQRLDETQIGSIEIAIQKAQTAVNFKRPSKALEEALVNNNRTSDPQAAGCYAHRGWPAHYRQR